MRTGPIELKFKDWYVQKFVVPDLKVHLHYEAIYADMAEAFAAGYQCALEAEQARESLGGPVAGRN